MMKIKSFWYKLTHRKKRKHHKSRENRSNAYSTLPYYYPTEQVNNASKLRKKKKRYA
jgi:hypothetical protein